MKQTNKLYCFSPPVMIATFVIEIGAAIYALFRYKLTSLTRLVALTLACLAVFQLAEFNVCEGHGFSALVWSRIGYVAITLLPPLGLHLVHVLAGKRRRWLVGLGYLAAAVCISVITFSSSAFVNHVCAGNYVIFRLASGYGGFYFVYYYGILIIGLLLSLYYSVGAKKLYRQALILQAVGYLSFLLPTAIVNTVDPQTIAGIPSIMCGFAVIYAFILAVGIAPLSKRRT